MKDIREREILEELDNIRKQLDKYSARTPLGIKTPPGSTLEEAKKRSTLHQKRKDLLSELEEIRISKSD